MLVRTEVLRRLGGLDENLLSTRENVDFCLALRQLGERVYAEPRSKITYLAPAPLRLSDVPFFALRWSDRWDLSSFHYLRDKCGTSTKTSISCVNTKISVGGGVN